MATNSSRSAGCAVVAVVLKLLLVPPDAWAQSDAELNALNQRVLQLDQAGKYLEAIPLAERYVEAIKARHGSHAPQYATALNNLANLLQASNRLAEAEPLLRRALSINEKSFGPEHPNVAISLNNLAALLKATNRLADAEPPYRRAIAILEKSVGADHPNVASALTNLANLLADTNRLAEAEPLYRRALSIDEKSFGREHPNVARDINNLAGLLQATNRLGEAEPLFRRALSIREKSFGPEHPNVAGSLNRLAQLLMATNRHAEAEPLLRRALSIDEKSFGPEHPNVASSLNNLAGLLHATNRLAEAEPLFRRALSIREKSFGPHHPDVARSLSNLAGLLMVTNRLGEVEPLLRRALSIREKSFGPHHPDVASDLHNLAGLLKDTDRSAEAEPLYRRALSIDEKSFGPEHPNVAIALNGLADLLRVTNWFAEAEPLYRRALSIHEKSFGREPSVARVLNSLALLLRNTNQLAEAEPLMRRALAINEKGMGTEHPNVATQLTNLAVLRAERGDWAEAAALGRRAKPILIARRGEAEGDRAGIAKAALVASTWALRIHARATFRAGAATTASREEGFELAQWALQSGAADALAQMSVRFAKGTGPLAMLVRERQDLLSRRQGEDRRLLAILGRANAPDAETVRQTIAGIDARLDAIDVELRGKFKDYAELANSKPLNISETQALLGHGEVLLLFLDVPQYGRLPEETLVFFISKSELRWHSTPLGRELAEHVTALRCGLDQAAWDGDGAARCGGLLRVEAARTGNALPFDLARAHDLYRALFGQVEDLLKGKRLLVVASGPLTALPLQVLVTDKPAAAIPVDATGYRDAAWLAKSHAVSVLPSVSSLKALRQFAKTTKATQPLIGFGNPLLLGPDGGDKRAWEHQTCKTRPTSVLVARRGVRSPMPKFFRSGLANVEEVRAQYPLPETADELCAVAQSIGAAEGAIYLGERASESTIKALSANGTLARARVVHFATHGLLAGETEMLTVSRAEPALILTPPATASEQDDGLLTASEIAQLKLDADWVVLSACNTAAGEHDRPGAEALSGLARTFFYAGARALLVSHWAVNSEATVDLIIKAFDELKTDPKIGRAEAVRRSMLALITKGGSYAHPANWSPFVVVGEGSR